MTHDWEGETPLIQYGDPEDANGSEVDGAIFVRVCPECGRFVKADKTLVLSLSGPTKGPNASCSKHGRIEMPFMGYP